MPEANFPLTPPDKLINTWRAEGYHQDYCKVDDYLYHKIAEWGYEQRGADLEAKLQKARDEELEACCEYIAGPGKWFGNPEYRVAEPRKHRRPKPPSLAEESLEELQLIEGAMYSAELGCDFTATRRALKRLQELEAQADG